MVAMQKTEEVSPLEIPTILGRRRALGLIAAAAGTLVLTACGGSDGSSGDIDSGSGSGGTGSGGSGSSGGGGCTEIPEETNGPYPADGSQRGVTNVLSNSAVVRRDITSDFDGSDTQPGVPLTLTINVEDVGDGCAVLEGAAVYIWQCNASGEYSVYGNNSAYTYLRGVQIADSSGQVTFKTIYPGRYTGRATHIHVEVYADDSFNTLLKTSQFAFDDDVNDTVYATSAYSKSAATRETTNDEDDIFNDGYADELLSLSGNVNDGYTATITMGVTAT